MSMGFFRQEYWSRLPFPSSGDLPDPGTRPTAPALQADSLLLSHRGSQSLSVGHLVFFFRYGKSAHSLCVNPWIHLWLGYWINSWKCNYKLNGIYLLIFIA